MNFFEISCLVLLRILLRSEIFDLTRFPVSDGAGIKGGAHCRYFLFLLCVSEIKHIFHFLDFFVFFGKVGDI